MTKRIFLGFECVCAFACTHIRTCGIYVLHIHWALDAQTTAQRINRKRFLCDGAHFVHMIAFDADQFPLNALHIRNSDISNDNTTRPIYEILGGLVSFSISTDKSTLFMSNL